MSSVLPEVEEGVVERCRLIWSAHIPEQEPSPTILRVVAAAYQRGMNRSVRDLLNIVGLHVDPHEFRKVAFRKIQERWAAEVERRTKAERERDEARAWANYFKASHHSGYYLEEHENAEEAKAINAAEEALLQLGINPSEEEPSWKR